MLSCARLASILTTMRCMFGLYWHLKDRLDDLGVVAKFTVIKVVVFLAVVQGVLLTQLLAWGWVEIPGRVVRCPLCPACTGGGCSCTTLLSCAYPSRLILSITGGRVQHAEVNPSSHQRAIPLPPSHRRNGRRLRLRFPFQPHSRHRSLCNYLVTGTTVTPTAAGFLVEFSPSALPPVQLAGGSAGLAAGEEEDVGDVEMRMECAPASNRVPTSVCPRAACMVSLHGAYLTLCVWWGGSGAQN